MKRTESASSHKETDLHRYDVKRNSGGRCPGLVWQVAARSFERKSKQHLKMIFATFSRTEAFRNHHKIQLTNCTSYKHFKVAFDVHSPIQFRVQVNQRNLPFDHTPLSYSENHLVPKI